MEGTALAARAVSALAQVVRQVTQRHGIRTEDVQSLVVHGGNGRMADLLARQLDLPVERVWSETGGTGNLGSASLPVAWTAHQPAEVGPTVWAAVGAGLMWGAALVGVD